MKFFLPTLLLVFHFQISDCQIIKKEKWNRFLLKSSSKDKEGLFFMVKKEFYNNQIKHDQNISLVKKLDEEYYIVKYKNRVILNQSLTNENIWAINDQWKLAANLEKFGDNIQSTFIIKSNCTLSANMEQELMYSDNQDSYYLINTSLKQIKNEFLHNDCVTYIGSESMIPQTESNVRDLNLTFNDINRLHIENPGLDGTGITVSIKEDIYDLNDLDLLGKDIPSGISSERVDNHATEMATIIGGRGNTYITGRGVAKEVKISSSNFADLFPDTDLEFSNLEINLQNHSYGTAIENFYGSLAESYDASTIRNPNILHIFSSGNRGLFAGTGNYSGIIGAANLTGNFKMSKNTLSIGSVDDHGLVIPTSSRGPAYDGRVKPELVSYSFIGTSNSAAMTTGLSSLIIQSYQEKHKSLPSSALIKALLINGAKDVGTKGLDYATGYGSIQGKRTIDNLNADQFILGEIANDASLTYELDIPENAVNLKITIVWTDLPSNAGNLGRALVNDIDMSLTGNGDSWLPWTLNGNPNNIEDLAIRTEDHLNNIEQITVENPSSGIYQINLKGTEITNDLQSFAISYQWDIENNFQWTYPSKGDNLPYDGETTPFLQWNNTYPASSVASLEYTVDNGVTWLTISEDIDLESETYRWDNYPDEIAISQLRMTINGTALASDEFIISRPLDINAGFDCGDSLLFEWNKVNLASSYNIYTLKGTDLTLVSNTSDTSLLVEMNDFPSNFISIEPLLADNRQGLRSLVFDLQQRNSACYLSSFFPIAFPQEERIELSTSITSIANVVSIVFEKSTGNGFEPIGSLTPTNREILFDDLNPSQGINIYRTVIVINNGERIISDESEVYYFTDKPFLMFPNPVEQASSISIFTKDFNDSGVVIDIYNMQGELIISKEILSDRDRISTLQFQSGIYIYQIKADKYNQSGRIIIE